MLSEMGDGERDVYRGQIGQWAHYLHRLSGLAIVVYVVDHVLSIGRAAWGREAYNSLIIDTYAAWPYRFGLLLLIGAVVYHAISGLRVTLVDFWPQGVEHQKPMAYAVWGLFLLIWVPWALYLAREWWS